MKLKLDWASHEAAKFAVLHWHYSKCMPKGKLVKIGVWEDDKFVGVIIFGLGAIPDLYKPYQCERHEAAELVRIALRDHVSPVSRMVAIALKMLRRLCPGLKVVVSFADANRDHHGGIYQAGNWVYTGMTGRDTCYAKNGRLYHGRAISHMLGTRRVDVAKHEGFSIVKPLGKHRYVMPFDDNVKNIVMPMRQPYPKRATSKDNVASGFQLEEGGENPTVALHP